MMEKEKEIRILRKKNIRERKFEKKGKKRRKEWERKKIKKSGKGKRKK